MREPAPGPPSGLDAPAGEVAVDTIGGLLARAAGVRDHGLSFIARDERATLVSWQELARRAGEVAGGLAALGVGPGERVALVYPTAPEFFAAFFGVLVAGAVPVPLYPPVRLGRLDEYHRRTAGMLRAAGCRLVLADRLVRRLLGESLEAAACALGCRVLGELPAGPGPRLAVDGEALALVQFSSGTTVDPKPVALSHRALLAQTWALLAHWPDRPDRRHRGASWLPLYHDMGLVGCVLPALARGTDLALLPPELFVARPALWLRMISRYRATVSPAPNFAYGLCVAKVRDEELDGVDLSCWEAALNGAEAVAPDVLRAFCERFARWGFRREALTPVYGLSEAALAVTFSALGEPFRTRRYARSSLALGQAVEPAADGRELPSVGRPLAGFALAIRDAAARDLPAGTVGRVWVRGPSLMTGYLGRPEATARVLVDGWLDTGDLGFVAAGELYLVGRAKDVLILRGRNHAPEEVEQVVSALPAVRTGCVAAVSYLPEGADGERLVVLVEARKGSPAAGERLRATVTAAVLAACGLAVDRVEVLAPGTLPRTSSGKIRRGEALRLLLAGELVAPARVGALGVLLAMARSERARRRAARRAGGSAVDAGRPRRTEAEPR